MAKIFISIPMTGRDENVVKEEMYSIMETKFPNDTMIDQMKVTSNLDNYVDIMGADIRCMSQADHVYFAPGWENSRGCLIEKRVCDAYGIPYTTENDNHKVQVITSSDNTVSGMINLLTSLPPDFAFGCCGIECTSIWLDSEFNSASVDSIDWIQNNVKENFNPEDVAHYTRSITYQKE